MTSRTQVAEYLAQHLDSEDRVRTIKSVTDWLKKNDKVRQLPYFINDVVMALSKKGYLFATITTSKTSSDITKKQVIQFLKNLPDVSNVECQWKIDPKIIGGIIIDTPKGTLDASIKGRLSKIVEGVSL